MSSVKHRPRYSSQSSWHWRRVVVGVDGGDASLRALRWYLENVHKSNCHVVVVFVAPILCCSAGSSSGVPDVAVGRFYADMEDTVQQIRSAVQSMCGEEVCHEIIQVEGHTGKKLCEVARDKSANLLVVGSPRRRSGASRRRPLSPSSVSDFVLRHAHCPVCVW